MILIFKNFIRAKFQAITKTLEIPAPTLNIISQENVLKIELDGAGSLFFTLFHLRDILKSFLDSSNQVCGAG